MNFTRREYTRILFNLAIASILPVGTAAENWHRALRKAGNTSDSEEQYQLLVKLQLSGKLPPGEQEQLDLLLDFMDRWLHGKEKHADLYEGTSLTDNYLSGFFSGQIRPDNWLLPKVPPTSAIFPLIAFYRAKALIAEVIEKGEISSVPSLKAKYYGEASNLLRQASKEFPKNTLISMYLGQPIPWTMNLNTPNSAPLWAVQQRDTLTKLTDIVSWWVENRQIETGAFGGGWGDDVEMWRKWTPLLLGFEESEINQSQARLCEGLFATDRIKEGYSNKLTDVEHTAEDTGDSITSMMHIAPEDPIWHDRAMHLLDLMENVWTGTNDRGFLQFKSTYFIADHVDPDPRKACDTVYHPRAIQPALLHWQRTGNTRIGKLVMTWMYTWVEATARESRGKPAGIIPSAIHWPDGEAGGTTETWWDPGNHTADPLYVWPSATSIMLNTLLLTWYISGDEKYLEPMRSMTDHFIDFEKKPGNQRLTPGSLAWCANQMQDFLPDVLSKYRMLSNDPTYDAVLEAYADGYTNYRLTGDRKVLEDHISSQYQSLAYNEVAFKSEVRWTDRLFRFIPRYYNEVATTKIPAFDPSFLFQCISGNVGDPLYFPINAVKWKTSASDIAVLVTKNSGDEFEAEIYHFRNQNRTLGAYFYLLKPGSYRLTIRDRDTIVTDLQMTIQDRTKAHYFIIPPRQLVTLSIIPNA